MGKRRRKPKLRSGLEDSIRTYLPKGTKYEPYIIEYWQPVPSAVCDECGNEEIYKLRKYLLDFHLPNGVLIEAKGKFLPPERTKHLLLQEQYTGEIRFIFMLDNWLTRKHASRYSDWAAKNNIKYIIWQNSARGPVRPEAIEELEQWVNETNTQ
jgi:hypothetical protein